jgi:hypothetical protein
MTDIDCSPSELRVAVKPSLYSEIQAAKSLPADKSAPTGDNVETNSKGRATGESAKVQNLNRKRHNPTEPVGQTQWQSSCYSRGTMCLPTPSCMELRNSTLSAGDAYSWIKSNWNSGHDKQYILSSPNQSSSNSTSLSTLSD